MRTMRDLSPRLSSASVIAPPRFYSQSKEGVHDCAKSRIENRGRNAQHLPSFLFFSPSFSENNATHRPVSRKGDTKNFRRLSKYPCKKLHPTAPSTQKHATEEPADAGYAHSRPPNLRALPPPSRVSFAHKKTATHLPMDSCLKICGR